MTSLQERNIVREAAAATLREVCRELGYHGLHGYGVTEFALMYKASAGVFEMGEDGVYSCSPVQAFRIGVELSKLQQMCADTAGMLSGLFTDRPSSRFQYWNLMRQAYQSALTLAQIVVNPPNSTAQMQELAHHHAMAARSFMERAEEVRPK